MAESISSGRTYKDAINLLNTCQSNAATIEAIRAAGPSANQLLIPEMLTYLSRLGYTPSDLNKLNVVHVTGTKGKGSTCAFVERVLRGVGEEKGALGIKDGKGEWAEWEGGVGLYTSPHLCAVRERIRINGAPIPETLFAHFFFEVWDRLSLYSPTSPSPPTASSPPLASSSPSPPPSSLSLTNRPILPSPDLLPVNHPLPTYPVYFRFLTLLSLHTFLSLRTKLTILEVGIGGLYDSTNIVPKPLVAGVSRLGLDHTFVLGNTVQEIARNKGGIYKKGVPAVAVEMERGEGEKELRECAEKAEASSFNLIPINKSLESIKLGLPGSHQTINASLALALCKSLILSPSLPPSLAPLRSALPPDATPTDPSVPLAWIPFLESTRWPGRCQTVLDPTSASSGTGKTRWYLDGAHTVESLTCCGEWVFGPDGMPASEDSTMTGRKRVLVFNCTSGRSAPALLGALLDAGKRVLGEGKVDNWFDEVVFCTNVTYSDGGFKGDLSSKAIDPKDLSALATQHALATTWSELVPAFPKEHIQVCASIEDAVNIVRGLEGGEDVQVLVAGSLHLVGGVMEVAGLAEVAL